MFTDDPHGCDRERPMQTPCDEERARSSTGGIRGGAERLGRWMWSVVVRNRVALAIASLIWLVWRSGTKPSRITYPCQQAAAANLGFLAVLFIPGISKLRSRQASSTRARAFALATGSVCLAGVMFILVSGGVAIYSQNATYYAATEMPQAMTAGTGIPATVAIVQDPDWADDAVLDAMVREAVRKAGGLESLVVDVRGGGAAPFKAPDGKIDAIIIPNMSGLQPGLNTDPRIVETLIDMAWEAGFDGVKLGGAATGDNWQAFIDQGYDANGDRVMDYDPAVPLIDLNDTGTTGACDSLIQYNNVTPITLPTTGDGAGVGRDMYYVNNELLQTDAMIVVPTLKNHGLGTVTLGLKMRIGTAPQDIYFAPWLGCGDEPFLRWQMHNYGQQGYTQRFPFNIGGNPTSESEAVQRSLVDLNLVRPHDFVVIDGRVGCEQGPLVYNEPSERVNVVMASYDTVAIDAIGALVMGYNPDEIPALNMANNTNVLGVLDRRMITVVGDHVADVRVDFNMHPDYESFSMATRAESVSPTMTDISLVNGGTLVAKEDSTVSVYGANDPMDGAVVKAELALKRVKGDNLLVNGDFESGSTGWSQYYSSWGGQDGIVDFASTEPGHVGNGALHLSIPAGGDDSFAVYQEVPVTPGQAYKIDAMWKANYYGPDSWYEIMLLDGPFDTWQADQGGDDVLLNHMFAYDTNDTAACPNGNGITASFDWTWTNTQYDDDVDNCWNDRDGVRIASGNVMTVVLKTGSCCGTNRADAWFDEVSLSEVQDEQVVATVADPPQDFNLVFDARSLVLDEYEVRVSIYDAMMNEARITRTVDLVRPDTPLIEAVPNNISKDINFGESCDPVELVIANAGVGTLNYTITSDAGWVWAEPNSGQSSGYPGNTHMVYLDCESLSVGSNSAMLTVTDPAAYNSPYDIPVTVNISTVRPDFDTDGDVDLSDYGVLQMCYSGTGMPQTDPACAGADLDGNGYVDPSDREVFILCMDGAGVVPDPTCDD